MTPQRKAYIIKLFHKKESELLEKVKSYPNVDNVNIISFYQALDSYRCMLNYSYVKKCFVSIHVIEEIIQL